MRSETKVQQASVARINRKVLLYVVAEDWYFLSHRSGVARAAMQHGWQVALAARFDACRSEIERMGIVTYELRLRRASLNPVRELVSVLDLLRIMREVRPQIVHNVALKPIMFGSLVAALFRDTAVINAFPGMGSLFIDSKRSRKWLRWLAVRFMRYVLLLPKQVVLLLQNRTDLAQVEALGLASGARTCIIAGSGVDTERFAPSVGTGEKEVVVMPARLLWDKGVREFIEAAGILRDEFPKMRFALVGARDQANPTSLTQEQIDDEAERGVVEFWGHRTDMRKVYAEARVVVLPSYREGLPKALLEASACAIPIVTTNVPGCNDAVLDGITGLLVPPRDGRALAEGLRQLLANDALANQMGREGRRRALELFSEDAIVPQTLALYESL